MEALPSCLEQLHCCKTNEIFEIIPCLLGMSGIKLKAKHSCFIAKPSAKDISEGKPAPPPQPSKPTLATSSPKDAKPVAEGTAAEKKLVTIDRDPSNAEKDGKPEASKIGK